MRGTERAVVVGSGPNGLAAAVTLAHAGVSVTVLEAASRIGGGARSAELTLPGVVHDECSAVHPLGAASPCFEAMGLEAHGLRWCRPDVDLAHPLDGDRAAVLVRSLEQTASALGPDGAPWRRMFDPLVEHFDRLAPELLGPVPHVPRHPLSLARFGARALLPASVLARRFRTEEARALFAGSAAHMIHPLGRPATASVGLVLTAAAHSVGWPVAAGGSGAITRALADRLAELGGRVETGVHVTSLADLAPADLVLLDVAPAALVRIAGSRLPGRVRRALGGWRHGPAAHKVDLAVEGGIPWRAEACRQAGTVHVGGTLGEIAHAEAEVHRGRMPERPFVIVAQQYLADPSRSVGDVHPVWAYAHVPHGYRGDATDALLSQIERFAPGTRERVVARHVRTPADIAAANPNLVGGDIATGANDLRQVLVRPRATLHPYDTGIPGVYLCSAATPPGAGVHGMCGYHAARRALAHLAGRDS